MRRLLPFFPLTALLITTMGVGSCGSTPLGSTDGSASDKPIPCTVFDDVLFETQGTCMAAADLTSLATKDCASRGLTVSTISLGDWCEGTTFRSGDYSCCTAPTPAVFKCGYGTTTCKSSQEYCVAAEVNGADNLGVCRPYSPGCTTCACARLEAAPTLNQVSACTGIAADAICTDSSKTIQAADTSPTLSVWCMVP